MIINIPGLHNSSQYHWQTVFEGTDPTKFYRVQQKNWDEPDCAEWIEQIENTLRNFDHKELILVGHSIGCIAIIKWFERYQHKIKGALLVAPSDAERKGYPAYITGFTPIPVEKLPFPSIVVASTDDHVTEMERAEEFAQNWGSELVVLEDAGHIEPYSGYGNWPFGLALIERLENK